MVTLRIIALRKSAGRFLDEPNNVYMKMREVVNKRQTTINDLFLCKDEATSFVVNLMLCVISKNIAIGVGIYLPNQDLSE